MGEDHGISISEGVRAIKLPFSGGWKIELEGEKTFFCSVLALDEEGRKLTQIQSWYRLAIIVFIIPDV